MFDGRLTAKIIKIVEVSYSGENGLIQAIGLSGKALANVKFVQEKNLITRFFSEISQDSGKFCYGVEDTLKALELGACDTIIVFYNLSTIRYNLRHSNGKEVIKNGEVGASIDFSDETTGANILIWRNWRIIAL